MKLPICGTALRHAPSDVHWVHLRSARLGRTPSEPFPARRCPPMPCYISYFDADIARQVKRLPIVVVFVSPLPNRLFVHVFIW